MNLPYAQQTVALKFRLRTKALNFFTDSFFFSHSNPNQQDYIGEDAKSLVFLLCSQEIVVLFWMVLGTHH
jgi:hypothetical protein